MLHTVTYWWLYEKCNAILDLCTMTICIMSKSTVLGSKVEDRLQLQRKLFLIKIAYSHQHVLCPVVSVSADATGTFHQARGEYSGKSGTLPKWRKRDASCTLFKNSSATLSLAGENLTMLWRHRH